MREHLLYITTDTTNGFVYGGYHHGKRNDYYLGSGGQIKRVIKEKGKQSFVKRELKRSFQSKEEAFNYEFRLIKLLKYFFKDKCYNTHAGGTGGDILQYAPDWKKQLRNDNITKGKLKQYAKGQTPEQIEGRKKQSETLKYKIHNDPAFIEKHKQMDIKRGKTLSARLLSGNLTNKEIERNKKWTTRYSVTIEIVQPGLPTQTLTDISHSDLVKNYYLDDYKVGLLFNGVDLVIKRRLPATMHRFLKDTVIKIIK